MFCVGRRYADTMKQRENIQLWRDYTAEGDYVVQLHTSDDLLARVMDMRNGKSKIFRGETSHHDAMRWAMDKALEAMYR